MKPAYIRVELRFVRKPTSYSMFDVYDLDRGRVLNDEIPFSYGNRIARCVPGKKVRILLFEMRDGFARINYRKTGMRTRPVILRVVGHDVSMLEALQPILS